MELNEKYRYYRPVPNLNISELRELDCVQLKDNDTALLLYCAPAKRHMGGCPKCGSATCYSHGKALDRLVHDVSMGLIHVDLMVKVPRYKCEDCGVTFVYPFKSLVPGQQFTHRLYEQLKIRALHEPFATIAKEYGIENSTVAAILEEYGKGLETNRQVVAPRVLGIDEKHIVHKMRGVFVDSETGKLLEMAPDNKWSTMQRVIESLIDYDTNIQIVTMDMSNGYRAMVEECLPHAKIIVDKYHVFQDLSRKTESARKKITLNLKAKIETMPDGNDKEYQKKLLTRLGKNIYLFRFSSEKIGEKASRASFLLELSETFPDLNCLRVLKEGAERIYASENRQEAETRFSEWAAQIPDDNDCFADFKVFYRTVMHWYAYVFNYFDDGCRCTNARTEGKNSFIEAISSGGRGYKFETLRIKCLFYTPAIDRPKYETRKNKVFDFNNHEADTTLTQYFVNFDFSRHNGYHWEEVQYLVSGGGADIEILNRAIEEGLLF